MACLYPFYVETFFAAGAALRRNDEQWLACIRADARMLDAPCAWAAGLAMDDACSGAPIRARAHLCPTFASDDCAAGRCRHPRGQRLLD